jgi:ribosomal protein L3 glutamine methyltransferase
VRKIAREAHSQLEAGGLLFCEVGDGRNAIERSFPDLRLTWLTTSAGDDMVFLAHREDLPA